MKNWPTRPTTDLAKEALYNILANWMDFAQISMLDLFGGTGNHCWEVLSRGCEKAVYVDNYAACVRFVSEQSKYFDYKEQLIVVKSDVRKYILGCHDVFDLIIADPPYSLDWIKDIPNLVISQSILHFGGILVIEHDQGNNFSNHQNFTEERKYGATRFSFFKLI